MVFGNPFWTELEMLLVMDLFLLSLLFLESFLDQENYSDFKLFPNHFMKWDTKIMD